MLNQPSLYWAICLWTNNGFLSHNSLKYIYDYKLGKPIHNDNLLDWKKDWSITTISYWENQEEPSDFLDILNGDFFQQPNFFFILSITNPSKEKKKILLKFRLFVPEELVWLYRVNKAFKDFPCFLSTIKHVWQLWTRCWFILKWNCMLHLLLEQNRLISENTTLQLVKNAF